MHRTSAHRDHRRPQRVDDGRVGQNIIEASWEALCDATSMASST